VSKHEAHHSEPTARSSRISSSRICFLRIMIRQHSGDHAIRKKPTSQHYISFVGKKLHAPALAAALDQYSRINKKDSLTRRSLHARAAPCSPGALCYVFTLQSACYQARGGPKQLGAQTIAANVSAGPKCHSSPRRSHRAVPPQ